MDLIAELDSGLLRWIGFITSKIARTITKLQDQVAIDLPELYFDMFIKTARTITFSLVI